LGEVNGWTARETIAVLVRAVKTFIKSIHPLLAQ
jgi:hypothetical protein